MLSEGRREDRKLLLETEFTDCYSAVVSIFINYTGINSWRESVLSNLYASHKSFLVVKGIS